MWTEGTLRAAREAVKEAVIFEGVWSPGKDETLVSMVAQAAMSVAPRIGSLVPGALNERGSST